MGLFHKAALPLAVLGISMSVSMANAATYYVDIVIDDYVSDFDPDTLILGNVTTGTDTMHVTGEVITSGTGLLSDVLLSWFFTMEDFNSSSTISSDHTLTGPNGSSLASGMQFLSATDTGLWVAGGPWSFGEEIRDGTNQDTYVGYVGGAFGDLTAQDARIGYGTVGNSGGTATEYDFFTSPEPILFGSTTEPVDPVNPISSVPLPAGLPMLMAGLGTFGFLRRRNSKS